MSLNTSKLAKRKPGRVWPAEVTGLARLIRPDYIAIAPQGFQPADAFFGHGSTYVYRGVSRSNPKPASFELVSRSGVRCFFWANEVEILTRN